MKIGSYNKITFPRSKQNQELEYLCFNKQCMSLHLKTNIQKLYHVSSSKQYRKNERIGKKNNKNKNNFKLESVNIYMQIYFFLSGSIFWTVNNYKSTVKSTYKYTHRSMCSYLQCIYI